ncbi:MAG: DUF4234 domain-containing protein [Candidatus Stahlbacteria bacterium]|nr:DUF4234 domain-containing protein [Candidatus Stahlbacteria bacterium]
MMELKQDGLSQNVRSFGKVFGLSIVTLGIYFLVYLFKTLSEMESALTFTQEEITPNKVRVKLIIYLVVSFILVFVVGIGTGIKDLLEHPGALEVSSGVRMEKLITTIISAFLTIMFWVPLVNLIESCHKKREIIPIKKELMWILLTTTIVLSFASIIGSGAVTIALGMINIPITLVFIYLIVNQVNRIWHTK